MSQIEVDKIIPQSGTSLQVGENGDTITVPAGATFDASSGTLTLPDGSVVNAKLANSSITINGSAVSLGGSVTIGETKPTVTNVSPSTIENTATDITITGTNFVNGATVELHSSAGAIIIPNTVSFTNSTTLVANVTISTDTTFFIRVENPDGNAGRSSTAILTTSNAPVWTTSAGSLGTLAAGAAGSFTVAATSDSSVTFSKTTGSFPGGLTLNSATGVISGTESGATAETTYNFTIRATDAEGQTADRAFSITVTVAINNSGQFN